jgi:hypothetical protein
MAAMADPKAKAADKVTNGNGVPRAHNILGVISKEHVGDSVAASVQPFTSADGQHNI